jgi:hypothetical protein
MTQRSKRVTSLEPSLARSICACCLLAPSMKDCPRCEFETFKAPLELAAIKESEGIKAPIKALPDSNPTLSAA